MTATWTLRTCYVDGPIDERHPGCRHPCMVCSKGLAVLTTRGLREFGFVQLSVARHDDHLLGGR